MSLHDDVLAMNFLRESDAHAGTAMIIAGVDLQLCAVAIDDLPDDGEAEAGAFTGRTRNPVEAFEYLAPFRGRDPGSGVLHAQERNILVATRRDSYPSTERRVTKRVVDQVVDQFWQQQRIAQNDRLFEQKAEVDLVRECPRRPISGRRTSNRPQVDYLVLATLVRGTLRLGQGEELSSKAAGAHGCAMHAIKFRSHVRWQLSPEEQLQMHLQPVQRRAQLMRGIGKQPLLHRVCIAQLA